MDWETEGVSVDHLSEMEGVADTEGGEGGGGEAHSPPCSEMQAREDMWVVAGQVLNIAEQAAGGEQARADSCEILPQGPPCKRRRRRSETEKHGVA